MARHPHRAELLSAHKTHIRYMTLCQAHRLIDAGEARKLTSNRELAAGKQMTIALKDNRGIQRVVATLTKGDMERNAEAAVAGKNCRSREKVEVWTSVHDTHAVTVTGGKVFIPDAKAAAERAQRLAPQ